MIQRDLVLTVNNNTASLNEPLIIYQRDRGITLRIKVLKYKFAFNKLVEEDVVVDSGIISARAIIRKPNGDVFECPRQIVEDDYVIITIAFEWLDENFEVGVHQLQLQLYGPDYLTERVTIPPVSFTVAEEIGFVREEGISYPPSADGGITDGSEVEDEGTIDDDGDLPYGIYEETKWEPGDLITAAELNKMEDAIEYLVRTQKAKTIYVPYVDSFGDLSWTNDSDLENPQTVNIMGPRGPQGEVGPQGPVGPQGQDGTVAFEELTDNQIEMLRGPQGEQGPKGDAFTYNDLTDDNKADLTQGFITCSDNVLRIEVVSVLPEEEDQEDGVLYILI